MRIALSLLIIAAYTRCMASRLLHRFWHKTLNRPFYLAKAIDEGEGRAVVLLHGIGRTGQTWENVVSGLRPLALRLVAYDLLGFGASPKPDWLKYDIDDHARAAIVSIEKLKSIAPVVVVGHSMGCLVAVRVARLRPVLIAHLVLYEMPLYEGLPEKRRYRLRTNLYFKAYKQIMRYQPSFSIENARLLERLSRKIAGLEVTKESWLPFVRSLENTIMKQTAANDIKQLEAPMDVIYGTFDMFVIRGKPQKFFGEDKDRITDYTILTKHEISPKASKFLVRRIEAALSDAPLAANDL